MASCHARNQPSGNVAVEEKKKSASGCEQDSGCHGDAVADGPGEMLVSMGHRTSDGVWNSQDSTVNECCDVCSEPSSLQSLI